VEKDPERRALVEKVDRAKLLEVAAEYDQAIALYEQVVANTKFTIGGVVEHLEQRKQAWQIKTGEQGEARAYIYRVWPKLDTAGLPQGIAKAAEHLKALKDADDHLTPRKLLIGINAHAARLTEELKGLKEVNADDENKIKVIKQAAEALQKLNDE